VGYWGGGLDGGRRGEVEGGRRTLGGGWEEFGEGGMVVIEKRVFVRRRPWKAGYGDLEIA
jgi:hypothetical protein